MTRAVVWRLTGEKRRGTIVAARLGQGFGLLVAGVGVWLELAYGGFTGLWLIAIAFLLYQSARSALVQTALNARIEGVRVADIMDRQPVAIPSGTAVADALDQFFLRYGWSWFPVVDDYGRFLGIARQEGLESAQGRDEGWLTVEAVLEPEQDAGWRVSEDRPITELLSSESLGRLGALMAVDGEGRLRGVVTVEQVRRALQAAFGSPGRLA
jgi:CBS-domain-containing membrane protein